MEVYKYTSIDKLVLVYRDKEGLLRRQPGWELIEVGPMIDTESGEQLELVGFLIEPLP